jgi:hypothetical protein
MPTFHAFRRAVRTPLIASLVLLPSLAAQALPASQPAPTEKLANAQLIAQDIAGAGRLRMQSQRLPKLYQQAGMGINSAAAVQQIAVASSEVDAEFGRLARYARKSGTQRIYGRSEVAWQEMRVMLKKTPMPSTAERVNQLADELMNSTGKLAMLIESEAETPVGRLLDLSSRLNMLAQRLARLYLQTHGGDKSQSALTDIEQAHKEFAAGLKELDSARENSLASREAIALAKNQWIFFDMAVSQLHTMSRGDDRATRNVVTSSERIAQMLDDASLQYAKDYVDGVRNGRP